MPANHPARFALVELVNIHDPGLCFEPIHRVVKGVEPEELLKKLNARIVESPAYNLTDVSSVVGHSIGFITKDGSGILIFDKKIS